MIAKEAEVTASQRISICGLLPHYLITGCGKQTALQSAVHFEPTKHADDIKMTAGAIKTAPNVIRFERGFINSMMASTTDAMAATAQNPITARVVQ